MIREKVIWTAEGEPFAEVGGERELAVLIFDESKGWKIEVTLDAEQEGISTLRLDSATRIGQRDLQLLPLGYLREAARAYLDAYRGYREEGLDAEQAIALSDRDPGEVTPISAGHSLESFAEVWLKTQPLTVGGERISKREVLARQFGKSVWWVDKRTREARDAGLIVDRKGVKMGRPRGN